MNDKTSTKQPGRAADEGPLSFYDHHRQSYGHLEIKSAAEFMVGDYGPTGTDEGVSWGGEFKVTLIALHNSGLGGRNTRLHPHLEVFGDATRSLRAAIDAGLLEQMEPVESRDEFSRRLIAIGLVDRSAKPIGSPDPVCPCCGGPR